MAAMRRKSVTSLVRTWLSTMIRRAAAKSVIGRTPREIQESAATRPLLSESTFLGARPPKRQGAGATLQRDCSEIAGCGKLLYSGRHVAGALVSAAPHRNGHVAEWLRNGLQRPIRPLHQHAF